MKLSEAIRLGEFALPPAKNSWIKFDHRNKPCGGCAVGRTAVAAGFDVTTAHGRIVEDCGVLSRFFNDTWPWTIAIVPPVPSGVSQEVFDDRIERARSNNTNLVLSTMSWAYEYEEWSITQIAEYVESFEPAEVQTEQEVSHDPAPVAVPASGGAA